MKKLMLMTLIFSSSVFAEDKEPDLTQAQKDEIAKVTKTHYEKRAEYIQLLNMFCKRKPKLIAMRIDNYDSAFNLAKIIKSMKERFALENKKETK